MEKTWVIKPKTAAHREAIPGMLFDRSQDTAMAEPPAALLEAIAPVEPAPIRNIPKFTNAVHEVLVWRRDGITLGYIVKHQIPRHKIDFIYKLNPAFKCALKLTKEWKAWCVITTPQEAEYYRLKTNERPDAQPEWI
jgi:hypothetical protein